MVGRIVYRAVRIVSKKRKKVLPRTSCYSIRSSEKSPDSSVDKAVDRELNGRVFVGCFLQVRVRRYHVLTRSRKYGHTRRETLTVVKRDKWTGIVCGHWNAKHPFWGSPLYPCLHPFTCGQIRIKISYRVAFEAAHSHLCPQTKRLRHKLSLLQQFRCLLLSPASVRLCTLTADIC